MPHVSRHKLSEQQQNKINNYLLSTILLLPRSIEGRKFLREFFTYTEKIMLAKRLTLIHSLHNEAPVTEIAELLKMSPSTIQKASLKIENGKYSTITRVLNEDKKIMNQAVKTFFSIISPSKMTSKRWEWLDSI